MKKFISILFTISFLLTNSCTKDHAPSATVSNNCIDLSSKVTNNILNVVDSFLPDNSPYGYQTINIENYIYYNPVFNPLNSNQIAYLKLFTHANISHPSICVYDFCSNQEKTIVTTNVAGYLSWGGDWILYFAADESLWKIHSDGTGNSQVVVSGNIGASISPSASKIIYNDGNNHEYIIDINGTKIDSIIDGDVSGNVETTACWLADTLVFLRSGSCCPRIRKYNLNTYQLQYLTALNSYIGPAGIGLVLPFWIHASFDSRYLYYIDVLHLYKLNLTTLTTDTLITGAASPYWGAFTVSQTNDYIFLEETEREQLTRPDSIVGKNFFCVYNLKNGALKKMDLNN